MPRTVSVARRRTNYCDLRIPVRAGVKAFQFKAASNFDTSFTLFETVPNDGLLRATPDTAIHERMLTGLAGSPARGQVRFVFDPNFYTATVAAVADASPFFIKIAPVAADGSVGADEAMMMVLPYDPAPNRGITISGTIPAGAGLANSLEIQLPGQCNDFDIQNDGAADLFVAFARTGAEYRVQPVTTAFKTFEQSFTSVTQIFLRGSGGTTTMSSVFTLRNNPI